MLHSLGGGTGSGMGSLILHNLNDEFPDRIISSFPILPSPKESNTTVEPYNTILSLDKLINFSSQCFPFENEALFDICQNILKINSPTFKDINHIVSQAMSGVTCCMRFPGQLNSNIRKTMVNLVPFPRLHFFMVNYSPLTSKASQAYRPQTVPRMVSKMFDQKVTLKWNKRL